MLCTVVACKLLSAVRTPPGRQGVFWHTESEAGYISIPSFKYCYVLEHQWLEQ